MTAAPTRCPNLAKKYGEAGIRWVAIGDRNYGEGSSREHAAMEPRFRGGVVILARSFARIHETNLKKQGLVPLTFADPDTYDLIDESDRINVLGLPPKPGQNIRCEIVKPDGTVIPFEGVHTFSDEQVEWFKAGSALNVVRRKVAENRQRKVRPEWISPRRCAPLDRRATSPTNRSTTRLVARDSRRRTLRAQRRQPAAVAGRRREGPRDSASACRPDVDRLAGVPRREQPTRHARPLRSVARRAPLLSSSRIALLDEIEQVPVVLAIAADLNKIALMDGNTRSPSADRRRVDLSVLLEHPAGRASPRAGRRHDHVPVACRSSRCAGARPAARSRARATMFLGHPVHLNTKLRRGPVSEFATIDRFDGAPLT